MTVCRSIRTCPDYVKYACALMALAIAPLSAAETSENVTVTETRLAPEQALRAFVHSYATPAPVNGKMTRWKDPLCPVTAGLPPDGNRLVTERVRQVAGQAGAPPSAAAAGAATPACSSHRPPLVRGFRQASLLQIL